MKEGNKLKRYKLVPFLEIDETAKDIAVKWVENYKPSGGFELQQKHKLASDLMNYANQIATDLVLKYNTTLTKPRSEWKVKCWIKEYVFKS